MVSANISVKRNRIYKDDSVFYHSEEHIFQKGILDLVLKKSKQTTFPITKKVIAFKREEKGKKVM